jgi:hypothetical protein
MAKGPRFLDLDRRDQRHELTSAFLRRDGDTMFGDLVLAGGRLLVTNGQAGVQIDAGGQRFYDTTGTVIFNFDTATGTLTLTGSLVAGELSTAPSGKRITIGEAPDDRIFFYSGDVDETSAGYLSVGVQGSGGTRAWVGTLTTGQISSEDRASIVLVSESKDGASLKTNVTLSADNILVLATTSSVDSTIQLSGDLSLLDSVSDPPVAAAGYVRMYNSAGQSFKARSSSVTAPLWPQRIFLSAPSSALTATSTTTLVPGMTAQFNTYASSTIYHAVAFVRFNPDGVAISETMVLDLWVDSVLVAQNVYTNLTTLNYNWPLTVNYAGTLVTPGVHTIEVKAFFTPAAGGTVLVGGAGAGYGSLSISVVG